MKNSLIILILLTFAGSMFAQDYPKKHKWSPKERMEQLEKIKLLEEMNLDEQTSIRFFSRRGEFKDAHKSILDQRDSLLDEVELALKKDKSRDEFDYKTAINDLIGIEKKLISHREEFINSLSDILTTEQIAKYIVFESKFFHQIRESLMKRRRGK
ncbi:MAG: hypothetical protein U5K00_21115 [Melioribacteraceae bacterium]|nr:hypothetical protein [Melioribacteraceae bacterium]